MSDGVERNAGEIVREIKRSAPETAGELGLNGAKGALYAPLHFYGYCEKLAKEQKLIKLEGPLNKGGRTISTKWRWATPADFASVSAGADAL